MQILTHSRIRAHDFCPRYDYWRNEVGLRMVVDPESLRIGSAMAKGQEILHKGGTYEQAQTLIQTGYDATRAKCQDENLLLKLDYEQVTVETLLYGYQWHWRDSTIQHLESEWTFDLPIVNPATGRASTVWRWGGKLDGIVRLEDLRLSLFESKTVGYDITPDSDYWRHWRMETQVSDYLLAARDSGHPLQSVLIDATRKPSIRPNGVPRVDEDGVKIVVDEATGNRVRTKDGKKWR